MPGQAGFDCTLSIGGTTVGIARDVTLNMTGDEIEDTVRDNAGWKTYILGLKEMSADFTIRNDGANAELQAIETAFLDGTTLVDVRILDADGYGFLSTMYVTNYTRSEPLQDLVEVDVTLRPSTVPTKITGAS